MPRSMHKWFLMIRNLALSTERPRRVAFVNRQRQEVERRYEQFRYRINTGLAQPGEFCAEDYVVLIAQLDKLAKELA